jgi:hypothetical protein
MIRVKLCQVGSEIGRLGIVLSDFILFRRVGLEVSEFTELASFIGGDFSRSLDSPQL